MANEIRDQANEEFRDFTIPGQPSSGAHKPAKGGVRRLFSTINDKVEALGAAAGEIPNLETAIASEASARATADSALSSRIDSVENAAVAGYRFYATKAALDADTTQPDGTRAVVDQDAETGKNGIYASTGGAWTRIGDYASDIVTGVAEEVSALAAQVNRPEWGTIGAAVPTGTGIRVSGATVAMGVPVERDGILRRFRAWPFSQATDVTLKRFVRDGNVFTQVGEDVPVILATGPNSIVVNIPFQAGEYLGFYSGANAIIADAGQTSPNNGWYSAAGNVAHFTDATATNTLLQAAFDIEFSSMSNSRISVLEQEVRDLKLSVRPPVRKLKEILDQGMCAGYLFDEASGPFLDISKNGLHIDQDQYSPSRIEEGLFFPGGKSFSLPGIPAKTVVACHYVPDPYPDAGGRIISVGTSVGGTPSSAVTFVPHNSNSMIGIEAAWVDTNPMSTTHTGPTLRGSWHIVSYQLNSIPPTRIRIGADFHDLAQRSVLGVKLAALLVFDRVLTHEELGLIQDAVGEIARDRGIDIPVSNRPLILTGVSAPNAPTFFSDIPSPYSLKERLTHPSVIDMEAEFGVVGAKWNGYRYWMAITPFPPDTMENPCIFASNDGNNWVIPPGVVNPIDPKPEGNAYHSDTDMVFGPDKQTMHLIWRTVYRYPGEPERVEVFYSSSGDGWATMTPRKSLFTELAEHDYVLSPTFFYDELAGKWRMYSVCLGEPYPAGRPNRLLLREANFPEGPYGAPVECAVPAFYPRHDAEGISSLGVWHIEVRRDDRVGGYICFASITIDGMGAGARQFYALTSRDGKQWFMPADPLMVPGPGAEDWDRRGMYRMSGVKTATGYDVFYSARTPDEIHRLGRTAFDLPEL